MHVFIVTLGTRGDVQPYVALGKGLRRTGHAVTVCTSCGFEPFITGHGLNYAYMNNDVLDFLHSAEGRRMIDNTAGLWQWVKVARKLAKLAPGMHRRMLHDSWESARGCRPDLIIYHPKAFGAPHFAEALGVPVVCAVAMPLLVPTRAFPTIGFPAWNLGGGYNRRTYALFRRLMSASFGKSIRQWRAEHGLPPRPRYADRALTSAGEPIATLHGFSGHVLPRPADWPPEAAVTGYWFLDGDDAWRPPERLQAFLDAGDPPVYVGFGSMSVPDPGRLARVVVEALRQANARGIIATGWGAMAGGNLPDTIFEIDEAPHDWLFPRTAAVVHHGGAGTTAAGLRAGKPTVICPFIGDQPFWGRRVHETRVGPVAIPQKKLTPDNLAAAIRTAAEDPSMRERAEALGEQIRREDGVAAAVALIETVATAN